MTRLILVGGFLGAGKTTLLLHAATWLRERGQRVGIVTNDQGQGLVDSRLAEHQGVPVAEVAGGCFCCRLPDLLQAIEQLQESVAPDVVLAEPVGSCTDLVATVLRPLHLRYPGRFALSPLTVLVDPFRAADSFPKTVGYLHERQFAEADILAISKRDLLDDSTADGLAVDLASRAQPGARVVALSGKTGDGVDEWMRLVTEGPGDLSRRLKLDYKIYGDAEATLGWLNARVAMSSTQPFSLDSWLGHFLTALDSRCAREGATVAHVKVRAESPQGSLKASLTSTGGPVTWDLWQPDTHVTSATLTVNARVVSEPDRLEATVRELIAKTGRDSGVWCEVEELECFSPSPPRPVLRLDEQGAPIPLDVAL